MIDETKCCCGGKNEHAVHTPTYCGSVPYAEFFPPYPLEPKYLTGYQHRLINRVKVEMTLDLPKEAEDATPAEIEEWLRFRLGHNPLLHPSPVSEAELPEPLAFTWGWA